MPYTLATVHGCGSGFLIGDAVRRWAKRAVSPFGEGDE